MRNRLVGLALTLLTLPAAAQDPKADSAKATAIFERYLEAVGGNKDAEPKSRHIVTVMSASTASGAMSGEIRTDTYASAPNLRYVKTEMPGLGVVEQGFDGKVAWSNSPFSGLAILPGVPKGLKSSYGLGTWQLDPGPAVFVGRREIDGKSYDVVRAVVDTMTTMNFFDTDTGLLARMEVASEPQTVMTFHDYQRFDGFLVATRMVTRIGDKGEMVTRVISIDHKPIDPKVFAPPPNAARQP